MASHILGLSSIQLLEEIRQELSDNPALEMLEKETCSACGGALHGSICPHCLSRQKNDGPSDGADFDEPYLPSGSTVPTADDEFDPLMQVATRVTLAERLLVELQAMLPSSDLKVAEYLIGNLDDNGYLTCSVEEAAHQLSVPVARVETVLLALQSLEPTGIGARDLRECLLIQLDSIAHDGNLPPFARQIVTDHLHLLAERKYGKIAAAQGIATEAVVDAAGFIREHLYPYPAQGYTGPQPGSQRAETSAIIPDVVIREAEHGLEVEVVESQRFVLRVTPLYRDLRRALVEDTGRYSLEEQQHIQHYVSRAKLFIANINQRRQTLHKITSYIVEAQKDFLTNGVRHLVPLTRAQVSADVGMHESTVSRATGDKYVMLPNRRVIPFADFFHPSLGIRDIIKEMIAGETHPLTDQEITERLAEQGIKIARRTVAKYRSQSAILSSPLRRA
jgi:RNA polymerase sigma-54 factor